MDGYLYGFFRFLYFVVVCAIVLALAFYTSKLIAKKAAPKGRTKNMKLLETLPVGLDKSLVLVKVGNRNFLFTNMQKNISCVAEISEEDLLSEVPLEFEDVLDRENSEYEVKGMETIQNNVTRFKKLFKGNIKDE